MVHCSALCWHWAAKYFGDCVCDTRNAAGFILGLISVACWGFSEVPQLVVNWVEGSAEAVSPGLMILWTLADILDVTGCTLSDTLPTMLMTAWVYFIFTLLLDVQVLYYGWFLPTFYPSKEEEGFVPEGSISESDRGDYDEFLELVPDKKPVLTSLRRLSSSTMTTGSKTVLRLRKRASSAPTELDEHFALISAPSPMLQRVERRRSSFLGKMGERLVAGAGAGASALTLAAVGTSAVRGGGATGGPGLLGAEGDFRDGNFLGIPIAVWGSVVSWTMVVLFLAARLPQIYHNWRRQSCDGLSMEMFVIVMLAGVTFVSSILLRVDSWEDMWPKLPFMVDALLGMTLDLIIIAQFYIYAKPAEVSKGMSEDGAADGTNGGAGLLSASFDDSKDLHAPLLPTSYRSPSIANSVTNGHV